jgi:hypothetical protein
MMASYAEMLKFYGFKTMTEFMRKYGLYNTADAMRMLTAMYDDDNAPKQKEV